MIEILNPHPKNMIDVFEKEFKDMTDKDVAYYDLDRARDKLVSMLRNELTTEERRFIVSVKEGNPKWEFFALKGVENLPAVKWKLLNIRKMDPLKHQEAITKLRGYLGI